MSVMDGAYSFMRGNFVPEITVEWCCLSAHDAAVLNENPLFRVRPVLPASTGATREVGSRGAVRLERRMCPGAVLGAPHGTLTRTRQIGHCIQMWKVLAPWRCPGRYRLSVRHAAAGDNGAFALTAWTGREGDGLPDTCLGRSALLAAEKPGQWSHWEFVCGDGPLFVGTASPRTGTMMFYENEYRPPEGFAGLNATMYFCRRPDAAPKEKAVPRFINMRLEMVDTAR
jgi:hypothetical protein